MEYTLGLDLGTSTVKAALVERDGYNVNEEYSEPSQADIPSYVKGGHEQNINKIFLALEKVMNKFTREKMARVSSIGVCGQMHGIVLWKSKLLKPKAGQFNTALLPIDSFSSLITWQDNRCDHVFLSSLPYTSKPVSTGYGCATLFWFQRNEQQILELFDRAGTVMDLLVNMLCGLDVVVMSSQNAYSWGYFDMVTGQWEDEILMTAGFPVRLLPKVVSAPSVAGLLTGQWYGVSAGVPVSVAMGDLQCSVCAVQPNIGDAVFNIGSASQLSVMKSTDNQFDIKTHSSLMEVPYINHVTLIVAASLTGGNAVARMVQSLMEFLHYVHIDSISDKDVYAALIEAAKQKMDTTLQVDPVFLGERHEPNARGTVTNICSDNMTFGDCASGVIRGIINNLSKMMPRDVLEQLQVKQLIGSGSTLHRNSVMIEHIKELFGLPFSLIPNVDAPLGAAIMINTLNVSNKL